MDVYKINHEAIQLGAKDNVDPAQPLTYSVAMGRPFKLPKP